MARSLKKGPFVDGHLREKVEGLNTRNEKKVTLEKAAGVAPAGGAAPGAPAGGGAAPAPKA